MSDGEPSLRSIQRAIEDTRNELTQLRQAISGSPLTGPGMLARIATLEDKVRELKDVQDDAIRDEKRRREEAHEERKRRDKYVNIAIATIGSLMTGLILLWATWATGVGPT